MEYIHEKLTSDIIKCFYKVYNTLGYGFLEKVYEKSLFIELTKKKFKVERQKKIDVFYDGELVGEYFADLIVDGLVIIEFKAVEHMLKEHENQIINYLKATKIEIDLLLNFGVEPGLKRKIFSNDLKVS